jgi:hypothetical protein
MTDPFHTVSEGELCDQNVSWILGSPHNSQPILRRFTARSHIPLLVVYVTKVRPDTEGSCVEAGIE